MKVLFKNSFLAAAILLAAATTGFSQTKVASAAQPKAVAVKTAAVTTPTKEEFVSKLVVGKWHIAYLEQGGKKQRLPQEDVDINWTAFKKDGTYRASDDGDEHDGKWSYNPADQTLTAIDDDGVNKFKVITVTSKEMVLTTQMKGKLTTLGMVNR